MSHDAAAISILAYRAKKSNGYDDATMALFTNALTLTPERLTKHRFWVAEEEGTIVGCIALAPLESTTAEIRTFYVAPECQRRGIGKRLWQGVVTIALSQGVTRLIGEADPATLHFYEKLGCTTVKMATSRNIPGRMVPYIECQI